jgi:hypothetical protein
MVLESLVVVVEEEWQMVAIPGCSTVPRLSEMDGQRRAAWLQHSKL